MNVFLEACQNNFTCPFGILVYAYILADSATAVLMLQKCHIKCRKTKLILYM